MRRGGAVGHGVSPAEDGKFMVNWFRLHIRSPLLRRRHNSMLLQFVSYLEAMPRQNQLCEPHEVLCAGSNSTS